MSRARTCGRTRFVGAVLLGGVAFGCAALGCAGAAPAEKSEGSAKIGEPLAFSFGDIDGQLLSSVSLRGRTTAILFATTFDVGSQSQAKVLEDVFRTHSPRTNALLILLEPPNHADLARTYRDTLGLHFPIVLADEETLSGRGIFGAVRSVPTWVLLDREGRAVGAHAGTIELTALHEFLRKAE